MQKNPMFIDLTAVYVAKLEKELDNFRKELVAKDKIFEIQLISFCRIEDTNVQIGTSGTVQFTGKCVKKTVNQFN